MYRSLIHQESNFGQRKEEEMKLIDFISKFSDEESCKTKLREYRERQGVVCPQCGSILHYWKRDKECFECKCCHYRQSLKANTVMHGSQLPVRYWFIAIHLLTSTKKSISASELQRQLGHKNYNPIWAMLHKLRVAMGTRDSRYKVSGMVEVDEGSFSTETPEKDKDKPLKRSKGSQKKTKVLVMAQTAEGNPTKKSDKPTAVIYIKMLVIDDLKAETIDGKVRINISSSSSVISDGSKSYTNFCRLMKEHVHSHQSIDSKYFLNS